MIESLPLKNSGSFTGSLGRLPIHSKHRCPKVLIIGSLRVADLDRCVTVAGLLIARSLKVIFWLKTPQIG